MDSIYTSVETYGNTILYRGRLSDGSEVRQRIPYAPTLFVKSKNENPKYRSIYDEALEPIKFENMKAAREFVNRYKGMESQFPIYGKTQYQYCFISDSFPNEIQYNVDQFVITSLDIETKYENGFPVPERADQEITAITLRTKDKIYSFGCKDYTPKDPRVSYTKCYDEMELLSKFLVHWNLDIPDIITGWNVRFFDMVYLVNRIVRILGEDKAKLLSPWKIIDASEVTLRGKARRVYDIKGIAIYDYMELFRKYDPKGTQQESYKLDDIAKYVLGRGKIKFQGSLAKLYEEDFSTYMDYNIEDVNLVHEMNEKGRLIELALTLAYNAKVNLDDIFYQTRMWDNLIFNHLRPQNKVIPAKEIGTKDEAYEGAIVKDPLVGRHEWIVSVDLTSEYPKTVIQYNISPETKITKVPKELSELAKKITIDRLLNEEADLSLLNKYNVSMTPNGIFFSKEKKGFLPELIADMFNKRQAAKATMTKAKQALEKEKDPDKRKVLEYTISKYHNLQLTLKICLNSAYGALGNPGFRYFDVDQALGITSGGQLAIRWAWKHLNIYFNKLLKTDTDYVIAGDTDSVYINFGPFMKLMIEKNIAPKDTLGRVRFLDKVCKSKLQPVIDDMYQRLADYMCAYEQAMEMKRESIADVGFWVAKKNYALNVWNSEDVEYDKPKIKISGLAGVKSSYPEMCRNTLKELYRIVLQGTQADAHKLIADFSGKFKTFNAVQIFKPTSVTNLYKYTYSDKSIPIHVKGALTFNKAIVDKGLSTDVENIKEGEKIRYVYLKTPNPYNSHVMSFPDWPPKELEIERYIDYTVQLEKVFLDPARAVLGIVGWSLEPQSSLESFFA
jgi:DNA polymerase elongation subunit (family B)